MNSDPELAQKKSCWLDVKALARVEATSEDSRHPIESAEDDFLPIQASDLIRQIARWGI